MRHSLRPDWLRKIGPLGPLAALSVVMPPLSGLVLLGTLHQVAPWLAAQQEAGFVVYVLAFTLLGGLALLPTYAQTVLGGWAFGMPAGWLAAQSGFVGAALVGYVISRRVSGDRLEQLLAQHTTWNAVYAALLRSGFWRAVVIVALLRLPPNAPFAASNVALAALGVPLAPYTLGTLLGLAPRTFAIVLLGAGLARLDLASPASAAWLLGGLAVTVAALATLGWLANRALRKIEAASAAGKPPE
jgi:uncharacterized membrane protein YdjX (TVP38/TMEM64 family)